MESKSSTLIILLPTHRYIDALYYSVGINLNQLCQYTLIVLLSIHRYIDTLYHSLGINLG